MTATAAAIDRPLVVHKRRTPRRRVALYAFLTLMAVTWLFPLLWAAYTALRPISDTLRDGYISLPTTLIFPIKLMGMIVFRGGSARLGDLKDMYTIMIGHPPVFRNIDCMQLVMKRELWLKEGGWRDKSQFSDGLMYEKFAAKYGYRGVGPVLGEHH